MEFNLLIIITPNIEFKGWDYLMHLKMGKILLLTAIIPFLLIIHVHAHDASYGFSNWKIEKNKIETSISIDTLSIIELGNIDENKDAMLTEEEIKDNSSIIMSYVAEKLEVKVNNNKLLSPVLVDINIPDFTIVKIDLLYESIEEIEQIDITYMLFYEKSNSNHTNIATIYTTSEQPIEHVFNTKEPTWQGDRFTSGSFIYIIKQFIILGVEHILIGYDHILFLLALIVIGMKNREVIRVITAFTIAHSITLILAATEVIYLNSRFVESIIALSICYVALENIFVEKIKYRWLTAFVFGLIHGFGFAGVLTEIGIPSSNFISALLAFNLGVEFGQIILFILIMPILYILHKYFTKKKTKIAISIIVFLFGLFWLLERVLDLSFMPL
jgi:hydrogenase/urease accessory protein HupE